MLETKLIYGAKDRDQIHNLSKEYSFHVLDVGSLVRVVSCK